MKATAIVLSAGKGQRMESEIPKQYMELAGKPVLSYCLQAFENSDVQDVIIVAGADDLEMIRNRIVEPYQFSKIRAVIAGGRQRYDSVLSGLEYFSEEKQKPDSVLIHDGARPFITVDVINQMIEHLADHEAVIAGMPVKDTIKIADLNGAICGTTERQYTWMAQTPQAFRFDKILKAYRQVVGAGRAATSFGTQKNDLSKITDDAMVFSSCYPDVPVQLMEAGYRNIKITTPEDMQIAEIFAKNVEK